MFQTRYIDDQDIIRLFKESRNRVKSMALIHEKLYQSKEMARVHSAEYIRSLTSYLFHSYVAQKRGILLKLKVDGVSLNIDQGVLCGLIINELISNSLQHAFPIDKGDRPPEVYVSLCLDNNDHVTLVVGDNGIGFPPNLDFHKTESLGLQLVLMLVEQLEGTIELDKQAGTRFEINFVLQ
jgi:two-component sensor histidine kinase